MTGERDGSEPSFALQQGFAFCGGDYPRLQARGIGQFWQMLHETNKDRLENVCCRVLIEPNAPHDGVHQPLIALYKRAPRARIAAATTCDKRGVAIVFRQLLLFSHSRSIARLHARQNSGMRPADSPLPPFDLPIVIKPSDIDEQGHVNNVVYLSWVQDVAIAHWNALTSAEQRQKYVWVALRHEIDYKAEAVLGDAIIARTWTGVAQGMRFPRHTEIMRGTDAKVLCTAVTQWCPLERATGRPTRLPPEIAAYFGK